MLEAVPDKDIQDLEAFLDGGLELPEADGLQARLAVEPALREALDALRVQRSIRRAVWCANEPDSSVVMRLNDNLEQAMRRTERGAFWRHLSRWGTAVAACVLMGIWIGNGTLSGPRPGANQPVGASSIGGIPAVAATPTEWTGAYHVSILDENGKVQAVQQFSTLEKAREFANDLNRWQQRRRQTQQGNVQLVADQF